MSSPGYRSGHPRQTEAPCCLHGKRQGRGGGGRQTGLSVWGAHCSAGPKLQSDACRPACTSICLWQHTSCRPALCHVPHPPVAAAAAWPVQCVTSRPLTRSCTSDALAHLQGRPEQRKEHSCHVGMRHECEGQCTKRAVQHMQSQAAPRLKLAHRQHSSSSKDHVNPIAHPGMRQLSAKRRLSSPTTFGAAASLPPPLLCALRLAPQPGPSGKRASGW